MACVRTVMKRHTPPANDLLLVSAALALAACATACFAGAQPRARDASGRPVFEPKRLWTGPGEPYHCFRMVTAGDEVSQCEPDKSFCVEALGDARRHQLAILSGCQPVEAVSCYVVYSGGLVPSSRMFCWATLADCDLMNAESIKQMGSDKVSACSGPVTRDGQPGVGS